MTSSEIRQSFLDFFAAKGHQIVPSAPLMPDSPNLLFTNAGMNQFVPYFLGEQKPVHSRVADTQKCIRAGGKHNDLEDVGFDSYHHTFFEMLGNWSFGDYFKAEAIEWGWELLTKVWGFPAHRLYATVYQPSEGDPASFDQEAYDHWRLIFEREGLDPAVHIVGGNKKDNFWMMGDTGPCGPCSEIHIDLTEKGDTRGKLVNQGDPSCIEIWNLVFIQFNAEPNGTFRQLAARHVDTGMGFERVSGILGTTRGFTDFSQPHSNYQSDLFQPYFDQIEALSGKKYTGTFPASRVKMSEQEFIDCAFRVLADHIRTLTCSIADGILPGNDGRNYVLRRILRRAVLFGRRLGLATGFFESLVDPVLATLGGIFPEIRQQETIIRKVIRSEEEAFSRTLDRGMQLFEKVASESADSGNISGEAAFTLYDTYGFPLDLTELLAREQGLNVDLTGFEQEMQEQRTRARAAQQKSTISVRDDELGTFEATEFVGYEIGAARETMAKVTDVIQDGDQAALAFDRTPFYAEMGGQIGDRGVVEINGAKIEVLGTTKDTHGRYLHRVKDLPTIVAPGASALLRVDLEFRRSVQRHHTATHLLHDALRQVLGTHVRQAGSLVTENRLRFDFSHFESVKPEEIACIEAIVNRHVLENSPVRWYEVPFDQRPKECLALFGEKYGAVVRVVDIGGYSVELCGGTHAAATGELGLVKVIGESAIAAGTRRIEALTGQAAILHVEEQLQRLHQVTDRLSCAPADLEKRVDQLLEQKSELEKTLKKIQQKESGNLAADLLGRAGTKDNLRLVVEAVSVETPIALRDLGAQVAGKLGEGLVVVGSAFADDKVSLVAFASPQAIASGYKAGDIVRDITGKLGGKGGGKPNFAMGGGTGANKLAPALAEFLQSL
jgi:alanyl-tRNA synthetase